jgi:hypothetical protein
MDRRAVFSAAIFQIIGGAIMVVVLMGLFASFSAPFLDFMADSEYLNNFNKFTTGISTSCNEGITTKLQINLVQNYIISVIGPATADYLRADATGFIDRNSKQTLSKCTDLNKDAEKITDKYCYCLIKPELKTDYALAPGYNVLTKDISGITVSKALGDWDFELKSVLSNQNPFSKMKVLQCRSIVDELKCFDYEASQLKSLAPVVEKDGIFYAIVWLQARTDIPTPGVANSYPLAIYSYIFERPMNANYILSRTEPDLALYMKEYKDDSPSLGVYTKQSLTDINLQDLGTKTGTGMGDEKL